jgi:hypothetical protein
MDLLDDFDRVRATFSELGAIGQRIDSTLADEGGASSLNVASTSYDLPGLSVEATVRQAARYACRCWQMQKYREALSLLPKANIVHGMALLASFHDECNTTLCATADTSLPPPRACPLGSAALCDRHCAGVVVRLLQQHVQQM